MSLWRRLRGTDYIGKLVASPWRIVESQEDAATMRIVDSAAEQAALEQMLEASKPGTLSSNLHYPLETPFRYPPLRHGSRFGRISEPSLFYAADQQHSMFAECAFYRFRFVADSTAALRMPLFNMHTVFQVSINTQQGIDLTQSPFDKERHHLAHKSDYRASQQLGTDMRADDVLAFRYPSARCPLKGSGIALYSPEAFGKKAPLTTWQWQSRLNGEVIEFSANKGTRRYKFTRNQFLSGNQLPVPA